MGMFDSFYIGPNLTCPAGHPLRDEYFQSKVLDCTLTNYNIGDKVSFPGDLHQIWQFGWDNHVEKQHWRIWAYEWCNPCQKTVGSWIYILGDVIDHVGRVQWERGKDEFEALEHLHQMAVEED